MKEHRVIKSVYFMGKTLELVIGRSVDVDTSAYSCVVLVGAFKFLGKRPATIWSMYRLELVLLQRNNKIELTNTNGMDNTYKHDVHTRHTDMAGGNVVVGR